MLKLVTPMRGATTPLNEAVTQRRATQGFKTDPIADEVLHELLGLALLAPSGYNLQPWKFIVVQNQDNKERLMKVAMNQAKVAEAPVVVIACANPNGWRDDLDKVIAMARETGQIKDDNVASQMREKASTYLSSVDNRVWATKQTMIAFSHLMLLAESYGIDTAPMEGFNEVEVKAEFNIPDDFLVLALLAMGYRSKPDRPYGGRFELGERVCFERYGNPV